jgi:anti-sigma-K factor RskA
VSSPDTLHLDPELVALLALGEDVADPAARGHLAGCAQCRDEVDSYASVVASARHVAPDDRLVDPPAEVWTRVQAELAADREPAPVADLATARRKRSGLSWVALAAAACLGAVVGGGVVHAVLDTASAPVVAASPPVLATASLAPLDGSTAHGSVEVVKSTNGPRVEVGVSGVEHPASGFYEVWLLDPATGHMVSLGELDENLRGDFTMPANVAMSQYHVVDVSWEPDDGNPAHSTNSLARGSLQA